MNQPEAPYHLLVFDSNFQDYQDYFDQKCWNIKTYDSQNPDDPNDPSYFLSSPDTHLKYHAILLDFTWQTQIKSHPSEQLFFQKLKQLDIPLIIVTLGNTVDNYKRALVLGAAGFLAKEKFDRALTGPELKAIIEHPANIGQSVNVQVITRSIEKEITDCLQNRYVCFPHWTAFFGKAAHEVLDLNALNQLDKYLEQFPDTNLMEILRTAVFNAHDGGASKIDLSHFGLRLRGNYNREKVLHRRDEVDPRAFLEKIHDSLFWGNSIQEVAKKYKISLNALKEKLRALRAKYPKIVVKRKYPLIFEAFPITFMVVYAKESKTHSRHFIENHLKELRQNFSIEILDHNHLLAGARVSIETKRFVDRAQLFILLVCTDFLNDQKIRNEIVPHALNRQNRQNRQNREPIEVLPIILKPCLLDEFTEITDLVVLPRDGAPVINGQQNHDIIWNEIRNEIKSVALEKIWAK